jgi:hypothetical protein
MLFYLTAQHTTRIVRIVMSTNRTHQSATKPVALYHHPHLEDLRGAGFADVADAFAQDASSAILNRADASRHIRRACKFLRELPQGSTLIPMLQRMERRNYEKLGA